MVVARATARNGGWNTSCAGVVCGQLLAPAMLIYWGLPVGSAHGGHLGFAFGKFLVTGVRGSWAVSGTPDSATVREHGTCAYYLARACVRA
jgi:hypothetical protein